MEHEPTGWICTSCRQENRGIGGRCAGCDALRTVEPPGTTGRGRAIAAFVTVLLALIIELGLLFKACGREAHTEHQVNGGVIVFGIVVLLALIAFVLGVLSIRRRPTNWPWARDLGILTVIVGSLDALIGLVPILLILLLGALFDGCSSFAKGIGRWPTSL